MGSVTAEHLCREPEEASQQHQWQWPQGLPDLGFLGFLQHRGPGEISKRHQQGRDCFPPVFSASSSGDGGAASTSGRQELVTVGSRQWGHPAISSLLRVKIYDFAMYMDGKQARESRVAEQYKGRQKAGPPDALFYQKLRSADDVEMALMVRASRNLPIRLLAGEYERILKRRLAAVGGRPDDAALAEMVTCFREEALPEAIKAGASVRKGTVLVFTRDQAGNLTARADDHDLITVRSRPLCHAVFDLYVGDQPVSRKAKRIVGESFQRLIEAGPDDYQPPRLQLVCGGDGPNACEL